MDDFVLNKMSRGVVSEDITMRGTRGELLRILVVILTVNPRFLFYSEDYDYLYARPRGAGFHSRAMVILKAGKKAGLESRALAGLRAAQARGLVGKPGKGLKALKRPSGKSRGARFIVARPGEVFEAGGNRPIIGKK